MKTKALVLAGMALWGQVLSGQDPKPPRIDQGMRRAVLRSVFRALSDYYVYPDRVRAIEDHLRRQERTGRYDPLTDPREFAGKIASDIRSIYDDRHIRIVYDPKLEGDIIKFNSSKQGADEVAEADLDRDRKANFYFKKVEILPSNIGFLEFTGFAPPSPAARETVRAAMAFISHTDALIIDLRNNRGGNGAMSGEIAGYFFAEKTYTGRTFNRLEDRWTENYAENRKEITNGLALKMPVHILTSDRTFSAAEGLAYLLQSLKKAIVIGEKTKGGAHLTRSFSLGGGFVAFIPYLRGENAVTKTDWEGTGVAPDVSVDEADAFIAARNDILEKKLAAATDDTEKRQVLWLIGFYKSERSGVTVAGDDLQKYAARFAEFEVRLEAGQLLFRDTNQSDRIPYKLAAITPTLFQAGKDYQVEFILDRNGVCRSIKLYWEDGWVEEINRTK